jgi:lipid-binding SYLF domain-containing protein
MLIRTMLMSFLVFLACSSSVFADSDSDALDDKNALKAFMVSDVVSDIHNSAYAYAIFPSIGKGGIGIGGAYGNGRVYIGDKKMGDVSMTQLSIGLQLGGQAYRQVIYFEDKRAFDEFTSGNFEFGAQAEAIAITSSASASAGSEGTSASANATQSETKYHKGMIVFTMGKGGLMYQATLGGQKYAYTPAE